MCTVHGTPRAIALSKLPRPLGFKEKTLRVYKCLWLCVLEERLQECVFNHSISPEQQRPPADKPVCFSSLSMSQPIHPTPKTRLHIHLFMFRFFLDIYRIFINPKRNPKRNRHPNRKIIWHKLNQKTQTKKGSESPRKKGAQPHAPGRDSRASSLFFTTPHYPTTPQMAPISPPSPPPPPL